jgi:hypothetical protein
VQIVDRLDQLFFNAYSAGLFFTSGASLIIPSFFLHAVLIVAAIFLLVLIVAAIFLLVIMLVFARGRFLVSLPFTGIAFPVFILPRLNLHYTRSLLGCGRDFEIH